MNDTCLHEQRTPAEYHYPWIRLVCRICGVNQWEKIDD